MLIKTGLQPLGVISDQAFVVTHASSAGTAASKARV